METVVETITGRALTERPAWKALEDHFQKVRESHLRRGLRENLTRQRRQPRARPQPVRRDEGASS